MEDIDKPSQEYRKKLVKELKDLRSAGKQKEAREKLASEKESHGYRLADVLRKSQAEEALTPKHHDEQNSMFQKNTWLVSNEPSLYEAFPYLAKCKGVGIGVGLDQMLDIAVNSNLEKVILFDYSTRIPLLVRALLEIGRRHRLKFGVYPNPSEFLSYFEREHIPLTMELLSGMFSEQEASDVQRALLSRNVVPGHDGEPYEIPDSLPKVFGHLFMKSEQKTYRSWVSDTEALAKVFQMYEDGNIISVRGDLAGEKTISSLGKALTESRERISFIYLSNAETYIKREKSVEKFQENLGHLPVDDDTIVVSTRGSSFLSTMSIPDYTRQYGQAGFIFLPWAMDIRTVRDRRMMPSLSGRELTISSGDVRAEDVGLKVPKKGLVVSTDIERH